MNSFSYEKGYYTIYGPLISYYQRLWACVYAPITGIDLVTHQPLFDKYLTEKKARHTCLICDASPTDTGCIVSTADNPGTAKYICEEHYEILVVLDNLRKL